MFRQFLLIIFSVYLQTIIVFPIVLSTITGEAGTVRVTGINTVGITIIEAIDGIIMVDRDMTVIVITLVGIEVMDLSEDLTRVVDPAEDPIEVMDLSEVPIKVVDLAEDLTKVVDPAEHPIEVVDPAEDLTRVMAVIVAIDDRL